MRSRHTLKRGPRSGFRPSEEMGLEPIENITLCNIHYIAQYFIYDKLEDADFKFQSINSKNIERKQFLSQIDF